MKVLRVFNNNVVLAKRGNREVIATGRGLGFQAKPGMQLDDAKVVRVFVPDDGRDPDHIGELLSVIPPEVIRIVTDAMSSVGLADQVESQPTLVMALADHITGALRREHDGIAVEYPLQAEVQSLYPKEYAQAEALSDELNRRLDHKLPKGETVALALHFVNAGFATGDLSDTYRMTGVIQQMLTVIEQAYSMKLDQHSISVGRFITHLRYLFVRIRRGKQLKSEPSPIIDSIRTSYPKAMNCAYLIGTVASLRLGASLTEDEIAYLALHISRVTAQKD
ncbi:transcription antiterminator BglG [Bifidobacterium margollesii]|uniref:Transcription antiterminator BglG n=1 Tax=Bifidobacterium margollesii TaxID=2020964 RepID=A0A2N5J929_9BIFI|nr:PRD domain-containing protein [Bifidobacterium margollesii]PLS30710.1 transcription antiterminator BglG [Bifidobacterium margollesii]